MTDKYHPTRWTRQDVKAVSSTKTQQARERFRAANADLVKKQSTKVEK